MNTKFDQLIEEMSKSEGTNPSEVIKNIRQDLTKCGSRLENFKYQLSDRNDHKKAAMAMDALISIDNARRILSSLQD